MADIDGIKQEKAQKNFFTDVPQTSPGFFLKGSHQYDWGLKNRLSKVFNPKNGRTIMLAFDHGYFQGPTTGLERVDQTILPLEPYCDCLMLTRGIQRSIIPASTQKAIALRASGGTSMLRVDDLDDEDLAVSIEEAVRLNASVLAVQVFIGSERQRQSIKNLTTLIDQANRYGIAVMGVTAVGAQMARTAKYFQLATRIMAELGAHIIKCYHTAEDFETITSCCPVPIVIAGGKKLPELDALKMAWNAVNEGAAGVDMGRNIFQSDAPIPMMRAVRGVIHENLSADDAFQLYNDLKSEAAKA
ncbi:MAG: 3-hydroxy-5-phosphonooxypentane-2,4-dione thiolase [Verrucomicrobiota bacterium]